MLILMYVVFASLEEAKKIGMQLLQQKMIACANYHSIDSSYLENGEVKDAQEAVAIFKTFKQNQKRVTEEIKKLHSYQTPFISSIKLHSINGDYYHYLKQEISKFYGKKGKEAKPNISNPAVRKNLISK